MKKINFLLAVTLLLPSLQLQAESHTVAAGTDTGLGVGYAIVRFDTSVKFTDKTRNQSLFVSAEATLGLPDWDAIPVLYGTYRFSSKHAVGFSYFQVRRESSLFSIDETLGDIEVTGSAQFCDKSRFYNVFYAYTLFEDERSYIQGLIGINVLDVNYVFDAQGTITNPDTTIVATYRDESDLFAPMPLFGLDFFYGFTPEWAINTRVSLVAGNFDDYRGWVVNTNINARYNINKNFGAVFGISYFDADIIVEDSIERTDVQYGYDGVFLGLHALF